jgi:hypothetical protein
MFVNFKLKFQSQKISDSLKLNYNAFYLNLIAEKKI